MAGTSTPRRRSPNPPKQQRAPPPPLQPTASGLSPPSDHHDASICTPTSANTPCSNTFSPVAGRTCTPLSLLPDSAPGSKNDKKPVTPSSPSFKRPSPSPPSPSPSVPVPPPKRLRYRKAASRGASASSHAATASAAPAPAAPAAPAAQSPGSARHNAAAACGGPVTAGSASGSGPVVASGSDMDAGVVHDEPASELYGNTSPSPAPTPARARASLGAGLSSKLRALISARSSKEGSQKLDHGPRPGARDQRFQQPLRQRPTPTTLPPIPDADQATPAGIGGDSAMPPLSEEAAAAAAPLSLTHPSTGPRQPVDSTATGAAHQARPPANSVAVRPSRSLLPPLDVALPPDFVEDPLPAPLRKGRVQADDSALVDPEPLIQVSAQRKNFIIKSPVPKSDLAATSVSGLSSIAQLEATAERLSMTSSIDDAIRELHSELKRSDSRRSAILVASIRATSATLRAANADEETNPPCCPLRRNPSAPAAYQRQRQRNFSYYSTSATDSAPGRRRAGSHSLADFNSDLPFSRHGPGKGSGRSVRSARPSLAEISEVEPISLTKDAFDRADAAPISQLNDEDSTRIILQQDAVDMPNTEEFHQILEGGFSSTHNQDLALTTPGQPPRQEHLEVDRPTTANSVSTFQQAQEAFVDFDGVHCQENNEGQTAPDADLEAPSARRPRKQTLDSAASGQSNSMLYYPARVPTMLNLPPKLSNKPKTAARNERRSQLLTAMMDEKDPEAKRKSAALDRGEKSWLPDPVVDHQNSFAALSVDQLQVVGQATSQTEPTADAQAAHPQTTPLRRPQKLTKPDAEKRKSKTQSGHIPAQLRASVFFDMPSASPEIEIKDGSAMATLDSILDASARAPVSAFTDHVYAGKLGSEVYGKEKKQKSQASDPHQSKQSLESQGKRSEGRGSEDKGGSGPSLDGDRASQAGGEGREKEDAGEHEEGGEVVVNGLPTTLLAELQLRKRQQKERLRNPRYESPDGGMRSTLLEMDAVAEVQRRERQTKRVNLAWEESNVHADQEEPDDEDIPLAILAAKRGGARNMADVDRPLGLVEIRNIEDNEPLRNRQARLQGRSAPLSHTKRASALGLPATRLYEVQPPAGMPMLAPTPDPDDEEHEGETLGQRKKRLAVTTLPQARPVSGAFSAELLGQFGDREGPTAMTSNNATGPPNFDGEEETLGARRRRLHMEREAREREMSYSNLVGGAPRAPTRRMSMADIVAAQRRGEMDPQTRLELERQAEQRRVSMQDAQMMALRSQMPTSLPVSEAYRAGGFSQGAFNDGAAGTGHLGKLAQDFDPHAQSRRLAEEENRVATQGIKMSVLRTQMPQTLVGPDVGYAGGFMGGMYNDGTAGIRNQQSSTDLGQTFNKGVPRQRASMVMLNERATPKGKNLNHRLSVGSLDGLNAINNQKMMIKYGGGGGPFIPGGMLATGVNNVGGALTVAMDMASMARVEKWRQGVMP